jgi:putative membrane protein
MDGWGGHGVFGPFGMIIWLVILIAVIAAVIWALRSLSSTGIQAPASGRHSPSLDVLEERYARGEINRDEYLQKKRDITG